jgi:SNF2 family DNA or RNA helicase
LTQDDPGSRKKLKNLFMELRKVCSHPYLLENSKRSGSGEEGGGEEGGLWSGREDVKSGRGQECREAKREGVSLEFTVI